MNLLAHFTDPKQADIMLRVERSISPPAPFKNPIPLPLRAELEGRGKTAELLAAWEAEENPEQAVKDAHDAFTGRKEVSTITAPASIVKLTGLLKEYDYALIEDAKKVRNYVINRLLEESDNPDPRVRLKAVELLGKVTEVAAFTERAEVRTQHLSEEDLNRAVMEKLQALSRHITPGASEPPEDATMIK